MSERKIETYSDTWVVTKAWAEKLIDQHHIALEDPARSEADTNVLRGRIAALRDLLALADPPIAIPGNIKPDRA